MCTSDHVEALSESVAIDTELHSSNQHQSMDKPTKLCHLDCDIAITTIEDIDSGIVEIVSVQVVHETECSDNSDVIIVTSDSDTKSSAPAGDLNTPYCKDFGLLNFIKSQNKHCFSDTADNYSNFVSYNSIYMSKYINVMRYYLIKMFLSI